MAPHAIRSHVALLVVLAFALLAACSGSSQAVEVTPTPDASVFVTETPSAIAEPTATSTPEGWLAARYIANTGGDGVGLRDACSDDARIPGAWTEGTKVRIIDASTECAGWLYVVGPETQSWVRDTYLTADKPAVAPPSARPSGGSSAGSGSGSGGTTAVGSSAPMFVFGTAMPGAFVMAFADGQLCGSIFADVAVGVWSLEVGGASYCQPRAGDILSFTVNGTPAPTAAAHTYIPGGQASVDFLNQ